MFPFGDWRDQWSSFITNKDEEGSLKSTCLSSKLESTSRYGQEASLASNSDNWIFKTTQSDFDINNCRSSIAFEGVPSWYIFEKVFKIEKGRKQNEYINRRDVISKSIIRYFYKYLWRLLKQKIFKKKNMKSLDSLVQSIEDIWLSSEITNDTNLMIENPTPDKELIHFILIFVWSNQRILKKQFGEALFSDIFAQKFNILINSNCEASTIMKNIMKRYSHSQLQGFFENKTLRLLFKRFIDRESENFLNKIPSWKRVKCEETLRDFETNIFMLEN